MDSERVDAAARDIPWVIFDGDCSFCTSSVRWLSRRFSRGDGRDPRLVPWQCTDLGLLGTTQERTEHEALWVTPDGKIFGGGQAFAQWLRYRPGPLRLLGRLMALPVIRTVVAGVYRLVANNRSLMPGGTPACALPPTQRPGDQS